MPTASCNTPVTYFNCYKTEHYTLAYFKLKKVDLKEIKEDLSKVKELGKEEP